jgi:hypothetical protein
MLGKKTIKWMGRASLVSVVGIEPRAPVFMIAPLVNALALDPGELPLYIIPLHTPPFLGRSRHFAATTYCKVLDH